MGNILNDKPVAAPLIVSCVFLFTYILFCFSNAEHGKMDQANEMQFIIFLKHLF